MLDRFHVCPVCFPTRAEFFTGRYHPRGGVRGVSTGAERLNLDEKTIGDTLKAAGYATGAFGKWHNGTQWPYHPNARGFDEYYGFTSGHWGSYFEPPLAHPEARLRRGAENRSSGRARINSMINIDRWPRAGLSDIKHHPAGCHRPACL